MDVKILRLQHTVPSPVESHHIREAVGIEVSVPLEAGRPLAHLWDEKVRGR